jgi:hypothetical protein
MDDDDIVQKAFLENWILITNNYLYKLSDRLTLIRPEASSARV